jgi:hypothetical protein
MSNGNQAAQDSVSPYADPANPALPETGSNWTARKQRWWWSIHKMTF